MSVRGSPTPIQYFQLVLHESTFHLDLIGVAYVVDAAQAGYINLGIGRPILANCHWKVLKDSWSSVNSRKRFSVCAYA